MNDIIIVVLGIFIYGFAIIGIIDVINKIRNRIKENKDKNNKDIDVK